MQDRLTIVRPEALGESFAEAVRRVCELDIAISQQHLTRLDARLGCGDFESVLALIRAAGPAPALPIFVARYVRWTGDLQSASAMWEAVLASILLVEGAVEHRALQAALVELAPVATDLGDVQLAARLHGIARQTPGPSLADQAAAPEATPSEVDTPEADASEVDTREAAASEVDAPDVEASRVRTVVRDILGIDPDATRGRLRLRPRIDRLGSTPDLRPSELTHPLEVRGIRFADGSVSLSATRAPDAGRIVIRVEQDAGAIPITVLLEPVVARVDAAEVDGRPADLEPQPFEGAWRVPVQLVLDDVRTLALSTGPDATDRTDHPVRT